MRIQETDRVLKEARISRRNNPANHEPEGVIARTWNKLTSLFRRS
jgi:hypothetical protein